MIINLCITSIDKSVKIWYNIGIKDEKLFDKNKKIKSPICAISAKKLVDKPPRTHNLNSRGNKNPPSPFGFRRTSKNKKMKPDFLNQDIFENEPLIEAKDFSDTIEKAVPSDGFFVLQKPNCYLEDGMLQTDFVAYNLSLSDINLTEEVMYKLNVCPSHVLKNFQTIETQIHDIKPLVEQEMIS